MAKALVKTKRLSRVFKSEDVRALDNIDLVVEEAECVALLGPSGSGKSILLNIIAGIDRPTSGSIWVNGVAVDELPDRVRAVWRHQNVGFIFRTPNLVPVLTIRENVALPLLLAKRPHQQKQERVNKVLEFVGLSGYEKSYPQKLSTEQQQRAAIGRAIVMDPPLVLADEPTGELNAQASEDILMLLTQLRSRWEKTVILATDDEDVARYAQRTCLLNKGMQVETLRGRAHGIPAVR